MRIRFERWYREADKGFEVQLSRELKKAIESEEFDSFLRFVNRVGKHELVLSMMEGISYQRIPEGFSPEGRSKWDSALWYLGRSVGRFPVVDRFFFCPSEATAKVQVLLTESRTLAQNNTQSIIEFAYQDVENLIEDYLRERLPNYDRGNLYLYTGDPDLQSHEIVALEGPVEQTEVSSLVTVSIPAASFEPYEVSYPFLHKLFSDIAAQENVLALDVQKTRLHPDRGAVEIDFYIRVQIDMPLIDQPYAQRAHQLLLGEYRLIYPGDDLTYQEIFIVGDLREHVLDLYIGRFGNIHPMAFKNFTRGPDGVLSADHSIDYFNNQDYITRTLRLHIKGIPEGQEDYFEAGWVRGIF